MVATHSIVDRAMLVSLSIGGIPTTTSDKRVTRETAAANNADPSMLDSRKRLFRKEAAAEYNAMAGKIRQAYYRKTLPWSDDGGRVLTSEGYDPFVTEFRELERQLADVAERFMSTYDSERELAKALLGDMGADTKYPSWDKLRKRLRMTFDVKPIPTGADFRVNMSALEVAAIRATIEHQMEDRTRDAVAHVYERVQSTVREFVGKLKAYNPDKPKEHPFRDTVLKGIKELLVDLPMLKLADDDIIDSLTNNLRGLAQIEPEQLREMHSVRERVTEQADAILAQMADFIA